jgi:hypothetical protein
MKSLVTIVITTSPVLSHPSLDLLERTLASFAFVPDVHECKLVIVCDGYRKRPGNIGEGADLHSVGKSPRKKYGNLAKAMRSGMVDDEYAERYGQMKATLAARCKLERGKPWHPVHAPFAGVELLFLETRVGYGFALREALSLERGLVATRYVLVVQHDRTWLRPCSVSSVVAAMESSKSSESTAGAAWERGSPQVMNCVSFVSRSTLNYLRRLEGRPIFRALGVNLNALVQRPSDLSDTQDDGDCGHCFVPLLQFYDSTHVAVVDFYRNFIFDPRMRLVARGGFVEDKLSAAMAAVMKRDGFVAGHGKFGVYLYDDGKSWRDCLPNGGSKSADAGSHRMGSGAVPLIGHLDGGSFLTIEQKAQAIERSSQTIRSKIAID